MAITNNYNDLHSLEGLQFIPVNDKKLPLVKNWQTDKKHHDLSKCYGVGLVCGEPSGNLEALDFDLKYSLNGDFFQDYKRLVNQFYPDLLKKMVVQKTKNGGYHMIYRCSTIYGNQKLANRHSTEEERNDTFNANYKAELQKGVDDAKAREIAQKIAEKDKVRVLIESRGIGGQIVCFPTPGYELVYGDFCSISEISPEERDSLIRIARQFNSYFEVVEAPTPRSKTKSNGKSPFDDYNERGDVCGLLQEYGWKVVGQKGTKTIFLRPGQTDSASSGNFDHNKNWFSVFTTSTEFEPQKAYLPYSVYAVLKCNKDFSEASRQLYELGFGDRHDTKEKAPSTRVIQSRVAVSDNDFSFLATSADYDNYLQQVIDGTLPMGLTTGSPKLDEHFLLKEGDFVNTNGHDNTGKSVWVWWLLLIAAMYHGWKTFVFSSENTVGGFMRKMIQFYWGKPLRGEFAMTQKEYKEAKDFIEKHFFPVKAQEELYNYKDIINMAKKTKDKYPDCNCGMIDPYNSLKTDLSGFSKLSTHEYHYEALSEIKAFGQVNNFGWFVNHHAVTEALRKLDKDGFPAAPQKADTEGGGKTANKADDFLTIHRKTQHPTEWMITEIHVRKIKDMETGGRATPLNSPVLFEMYKGQTAFREKTEMGYEVDPIAQWHKKNGVFIPEYSSPPVSNFYRPPYKEEEEIPDIPF